MNLLIKHALAALYPRTEHFPGIVETDLDAFLVRFRREAPGLMRLGLYVAAVVFMLTPLCTVYRQPVATSTKPLRTPSPSRRLRRSRATPAPGRRS